MIDKEKTIKVNGVNPDKLAPTSHQKVWWKCDNPKCSAPIEKREREYSFAYAMKKKAKALKDNPENPQELCQVCSHSHRKGTTSTKKKNSIPAIDLSKLKELDIEKTQELFGHNPLTLKPWSRRCVVVICSETGKECITQRCSLNRNKGILEKGRFISIAGYTGARRKGQKASEETRLAMVRSQRARRKRERKQEIKENRKKSSQVLPILRVGV